MILVTGGAGFIGSNLIAGLESADLGPIAVADRLDADERWRNIAKREIAAIVPPEDLGPWLEAHASRLDGIFHLGAITATTASDAGEVVATNVTLSQRLWDHCAAHNTPFIYASSASVYGDGSQGFDDDLDPSAMGKLRPLNLYGWSKLLFDRWIARIVADGGPRPDLWAGLRFFNVYGPNEAHKGPQSSVVPHFFGQIQATGRARLFKSDRDDVEDGGQARDFIFVDDCVDAMIWLYQSRNLGNGDGSGLYNLGTGTARTFLDLAHAVFAAIGNKADIEFFDMPTELKAHYQYFTQAPMDRLHDAGYEAAPTQLEAGIRTYVTDFLAADDPYR
ncbi:MAG: ADP-glyceromanno-heptose 6-epimerase [Alphaproteobacteria bacterium]|nr:ADP-glyceromanno-heptose 6-epimerase [Alphaproteobacteria bacterium]